MSIWIAPLMSMLMQAIVAKEFAVKYDIDPVLSGTILSAASKYDIEPELAFALVRTESNFKVKAHSSAGAIGLTQIMPATARLLRPGVTTAQLYNAKLNLDLGFKYFRFLLDKYQNSSMALAAYNRGPGYVDRAPEWRYVRTVMAYQTP